MYIKLYVYKNYIYNYMYTHTHMLELVQTGLQQLINFQKCDSIDVTLIGRLILAKVNFTKIRSWPEIAKNQPLPQKTGC